MNVLSKIKGAVYGQALGDAMGMPGELWGKKRTLRELGVITDFEDGPADNVVAFNYKAGQFTDDTGQALVILDTLKETNYTPDGKKVALNILKWAECNNAFEQNILGPTSKQVLQLVKEGKETEHIAKTALSNGAAMRSAPLGCLFETAKLRELADYVKDISKETHYSDVTIAGAVLVSTAVSIAIECDDTKQAVIKALELEEYALSLGAETFSASIKQRVEYGIKFIDSNKNNEQAIMDFIYNVIGCGVPTSESVSAALLIAYYAETPNKCALLCANIGGDTDTIGAMATAICGAAKGIEAFDTYYISTIDDKNKETDLQEYVEILVKGREVLNG